MATHEGQRCQAGDEVARRPSSRVSGTPSRCLTPRGLEMRIASARATPCTPELVDEEDPEVELLLAAARSRRGVRLYPFNIHAKSVVDQVVFNHNLDDNNDDKADTQNFQAMFQDSAGRPSWKDQLRCKQLAPRKSGDPWGPIEDPRTMPIVPGGRRKFSGPVSKSVVDDILFGRDLDGSGTERERFYAMEVLHTGAAGTPSWLRPKVLGLNSTPGSQRRHLKHRRAAKSSPPVCVVALQQLDALLVPTSTKRPRPHPAQHAAGSPPMRCHLLWRRHLPCWKKWKAKEDAKPGSELQDKLAKDGRN